ncbi:MAG: DNA/RNA non-specific endonuclease [Pseudomonadota bacterium]
MHETVARALTLAHETFRCGVPHFRERRLIPIRTSAHLIVFDAEKISPLYTMLEVKPGLKRDIKDVKDVARIDNFTSGDVSLPDELCTQEKHYANWNKKHRDTFPVDKGHSAGSQFRRRDHTEQSDIDTLAGVTPEASATNRNCKGPLETAILKHAMTQTHTYLVQGPVWFGDKPEHGMLENGQWIPDALFISGLFLHRKSVKSWTWLMNNAASVLPTKDSPGSDLKEISLDELERLTDLYLWSNVQARKFQKRRHRLTGGDWWKEGQPTAK